MRRFSMTLPSNISMDYNPENTAAQLMMKLTEIVVGRQLGSGLMKIMLSSIVHNVD